MSPRMVILFSAFARRAFDQPWRVADVNRPLRRAVAGLLFALLLTCTALAQEVNGRFSTSFYSWEQYTSPSTSKVIARAFQTAQFDVTEGDVSFHTSLTGAMRVNGDFGEDATVRLRQLFVQAKRVGGAMDLSLGRIPIFAGVGLGIVDGIAVQSTVGQGNITLRAYGGGNVRPDLKSSGLSNLKKNFLLGGQIAGNVTDALRLGVSYVNRNIERDMYSALRADSLFNPIAIMVVPDSKAEQVVGGDLRYAQNDALSVYGRYDYDLNFKRSLRGQLHARVRVAADVSVTGEFIYREPRIQYNSFFAVFSASPSREYEGGVEYAPMTALQTYAKFAYIGFSDALSRRLTLGATWEYASLGYAWTNGYAGEISMFDVQGTYPLFERKLVPMVGVSLGSFRQNQSASPRQDLLAGTIGVVARPVPQFSFDTQVQLLQNPIASNDVRFFAKVNYWFHADLSSNPDPRQ